MSWPKIFYCINIFIILFFSILYFFHPIPLSGLNTDLGFHLTFGKIIASSGSVPTTNLLSYTYPDYQFINANWGAQVVFYLVHHAFGFDGLIILSLVLVSAAFFLSFMYSAKKYDLFVVTVISLLYIQILPGRSQVRPELFSFLFLALFILIIYRYRESYTKWIFSLIPLSLLWVNTHIYFFTGIIVLVLFILDVLFSKKEKYKSKQFITLSFVTIASILATICNPQFINGVIHPFLVMNNYGFAVRENLNFFAVFDFSYKPTLFFFTLSMLLLWVNLFIARKKMQLIDFFLAAFFTFMALFAIRNFPLFVFGTFIPAVKASSIVWQLVVKKYKKQKLLLLGGVLGITCLLIIPSVFTNLQSRGFSLGVIDNAKDGLNFMQKNNIKGPIYNNFDIGSYLDYYLYPKEKVFVDNRAEAYPKDFFETVYYPMQRSEKVFDDVEKKYNFNVIFFSHTDGGRDARKMLYRLVRDETWKVVYLDSLIVIFVKNTAENKHIIDRYAINEKNVVTHDSDIADKQKVAQLALFFGTVGWTEQFIKMNLRLLDFESNNCSALRNVALLYKKQNNPSYSIYARKYLQSCR